MSCIQSFDKLCRKIVCPTRHQLNEPEMIERKFKSNQIKYESVEIKNSRNKLLSVLLFERDIVQLPTVLYLHGNGGNKLQSLPLASGLLNLVAFDFGGCGKSEGEFITYGQQEVEDIQTVITFIREKYQLPKLKVALWGRSMGASMALMYASYRPQSISVLVLDSPFRKLRKVLENVAQHSGKSVPKIFLSLALFLVERRVEEITNKDVFNSDFLMHLNIVTDIPIMFGYSASDDVVKEEDVLELFQSYKGRKKLVRVDVKHHQDRPKWFIDEGIQFIQMEGHKKEGKISLNKRGISLSTRKRIRE